MLPSNGPLVRRDKGDTFSLIFVFCQYEPTNAIIYVRWQGYMDSRCVTKSPPLPPHRAWWGGKSFMLLYCLPYAQARPLEAEPHENIQQPFNPFPLWTTTGGGSSANIVGWPAFNPSIFDISSGNHEKERGGRRQLSGRYSPA